MKADALKKLQDTISDLSKASDLTDGDKTLLTELETIAKGVGAGKKPEGGNGDLADAILKAIQSGNNKSSQENASTERIIAAINEVQKGASCYAAGSVDGVKQAADEMDMACKAMDEADDEEGDGKDEEKRTKARKMRKEAMGKMRGAFGKFSAAFGKLSLAKSSGGTETPEVSAEDFKKLSDDFESMTKRVTLLAKFLAGLPDKPREEIVSELLNKEQEAGKNRALTKVLAAM